jgi:hypothetical protein
MEWVWRPFFQHDGKRTQIFTHALYHHYSAPEDFDFDTLNDNAPMIDDPTLENYNVDARISELYDWISHQRVHYKTNETGQMFMVFGDDFRYANAHQVFYSLDRLIKYFNLKYTDVQLMYSTPSIYIDAIS